MIPFLITYVCVDAFKQKNKVQFYALCHFFLVFFFFFASPSSSFDIVSVWSSIRLLQPPLPPEQPKWNLPASRSLKAGFLRAPALVANALLGSLILPQRQHHHMRELSPFSLLSEFQSFSASLSSLLQLVFLWVRDVYVCSAKTANS